MLKLLFWNLNKKPLAELLQQLAAEHSPDVILLAECPEPVARLVGDFNQGQPVVYRFYASGTHGLVALTRLPSRFFSELILTEDQLPGLNGRVAFYQLKVPVGRDLLLVGLHLASKLHLSAQAQAQLANRIRPVLNSIEHQLGHERTAVLGDFNMDPFESGLIGAEGFHALMDRRLIQQRGGQRIVHGSARKFFYNPMWSLLGDESAGPPGTYFYESGLDAYYWHTFDQVLLRPDLLINFQPSDVQVLTTAGLTSLLTSKGIPDKRNASDHLPLLVIISAT